MSVKKFSADNMQAALKAVTESLGPDALIISTKRSAQGVEILATTEMQSQAANSTKSFAKEKPSLDKNTMSTMLKKAKLGHKTELQKELEQYVPEQVESVVVPQKAPKPILKPKRNNMAIEPRSESSFAKELAAMGFLPKVTSEYARRYGNMDVDDSWILTRTRLAESLQSSLDIVAKGGVFALVGPTGAGKTTTLSKLATLFALKFGAKQLAIVSTDHQRMGAHDTLESLCRILRCTLIKLKANESLTQYKELNDKSLILIDTNGDSKISQRVLKQVKSSPYGKMMQSLFVVPANMSYVGLKQSFNSVADWNPVASVITKLDECSVFGEVLSYFLQKKVSIAYWTEGCSIPEDINNGDISQLLRLLTADEEEFFPQAM